MKRVFEGKTILLTGGTGSFGREFTRIILEKHKPKALRIFSRDELKQSRMQAAFNDERLRFFVGDVRDRERLYRAMRGVDVVVHAAALKQVPSCEYNPFEAVKTNILGAQNIIDAAIDCGVKKVIALSTDKAVNPINLYGATKLCAEKLFIHGNSYSGDSETRFSCVRYGNVLGSRGSVIPIFLEQKQSGKITITDERMTRFWITLAEAAALVLKGFEYMQGGETFIPKIPSMRITDLAEAVAPECKIEIIGRRPGEKLHEVLIKEDEGSQTVFWDGIYAILPSKGWLTMAPYSSGKALPDGFSYASDTNCEWLSIDDLRTIIQADQFKSKPEKRKKIGTEEF
jgi:UDP-N-acetylglucosamine 4,6-dehydratase/5-epimerase